MPSTLSPGLLGGLDELRDHVALGGDDEDLLPAGAVFGRHRGQHLEVEDGVGERDGDGLLRLELDGGAKLLGVDDRELHGADHDLLVGHAERETLAVKPLSFQKVLSSAARPSTSTTSPSKTRPSGKARTETWVSEYP